MLSSMGEESDRPGYTVRVKDRRIGLNPYRWAIYREGWPRAVKRAASVYRTAEKCRIAGALALREFLANLTKRKKNRNDSRPLQMINEKLVRLISGVFSRVL